MTIGINLGTIVGSEIVENMDGESPSRMLECEISSAEDVQSIEQINKNGEQTNPRNDANVVIIEISNTWKIAVAIDDLVEPDASLDKGEKKIYALDSGNNIVASILLKNDGDIQLNGGTDWAVQFTAMKAAFDQFVTDFDDHTHPAPGGATGVPVAPTTADMAGAKVDDVRLP
jgi:hypothetical protein